MNYSNTLIVVVYNTFRYNFKEYLLGSKNVANEANMSTQCVFLLDKFSYFLITLFFACNMRSLLSILYLLFTFCQTTIELYVHDKFENYSQLVFHNVDKTKRKYRLHLLYYMLYNSNDKQCNHVGTVFDYFLLSLTTSYFSSK